MQDYEKMHDKKMLRDKKKEEEKRKKRIEARIHRLEEKEENFK